MVTDEQAARHIFSTAKSGGILKLIPGSSANALILAELRRPGSVDALLLQADGLEQLSSSACLRAGNDLGLNLDAHLVVLAVGLGASVLLVGTAAVAATVVQDGDDGGFARELAAATAATRRGAASGIDEAALVSLHVVHTGVGGQGHRDGSSSSSLHDRAAVDLH